MEGFLNIALSGWLRRLITRLIAIVPAVIVTALQGTTGTGKLLLLSQAILSMQLSFAVFPLVAFTSNKLKLGQLVTDLSCVRRATVWRLSLQGSIYGSS